MRRREFITLLLGSAAWPLAALAQQARLPLIGYLSGRSAETEVPFLAAFRQGLAATGFAEGRNVEIEFRFANGTPPPDRLMPLAVDLVRRRPNVVVAVGGLASTIAARKADATIPIVFTVPFDPVQLGFVASFNRPGGNMTGIYGLNSEVAGKMLGVLHDLVPKATTIAMLLPPRDLTQPVDSRLVLAREAAAPLGLRLIDFKAATDSEIDAAFASSVEQHADALLIPTNPYFVSRIRKIVGLAARHGLPAMYNRREFTAAGGLISYGPNDAEAYRQIGMYAGRILMGEKPAELPVVQTTKFELVINLKTAKVLGLEVPTNLLLLADEVIE
jgi:putative ABC transport system substrate-binding protein